MIVMRSKLVLLAVIAAAAAVALYGATQHWVTLSLEPGAAAFEQLEVTGHEINQSLSPIAIAALAAALALTIAGKIFRRILGALVLLLGAGIVAIAASAFADSQAAAARKLAEATGLSGGAEAGLVTATDASPFIVLTLCAGLALCLFGALVLIVGGRWKQGGRKYESEATQRQPNENEEPDRISDWEAMNDGVDPSDDDPR